MISVIIPVYNTKPFLGKCINSVRRQSCRNWECIIVDDGSTDGSAETLHELTGVDERFIIVSKKKNEGLSEARNTGMECANGEYLFFLDSDDYITLDALDSLLGEATVHPDVGRIVGNYIEHRPLITWKHSVEPAGLHKPDDRHFFSSYDCDPGHSTGSLYIRKNIPEDLRFPKVPLFEDMIFNMGMMFSGASSFVTRLYPYHYIRREDSLLSRTLTKDDADTLRSALQSLADKYNPDPDVLKRCMAFLNNAINGRLKR